MKLHSKEITKQLACPHAISATWKRERKESKIKSLEGFWQTFYLATFSYGLCKLIFYAAARGVTKGGQGGTCSGSQILGAANLVKKENFYQKTRP